MHYRPRRARNKAVYCLLFSLSAGLASCSKSQAPEQPKLEKSVKKLPELLHRSRKVMGSQITLTVIKNEVPKLDLLVEEVFREFSRLEALLSVWKLGSDVVAINKAAGVQPVKVSEETINILKEAAKVSQRTSGKFDVSFGALSGLWRFDHDQDNKIPDPKIVKERLSLIDYESITIDDKARTVQLEKKGYEITSWWNRKRLCSRPRRLYFA